jgi:hypothetical protein
MTATSTERRRVTAPRAVIPASQAFRAAWVAVTLAVVTFRAVTTNAWSYLQDDWVLIVKAHETPLVDFVTQDGNGHLMPIGSLVIWLTTAYDPLNFVWATVLTCVFTLAVMVGWGLALRELFGERLHLIGGLVLIGFAPSILPIGVWWCANLIYLPLQATIGFAVWFLARYLLRGQRRKDVVGVTLTVVVGLLFWQKAVLVAIPLAFLPLLVVEGSLWERLRRGVAGVWPSALVIAGYLVYYLTVPRPTLDTFGIEFPRGRRPGQILEFYEVAATNLVLPSMLGGPFGEMSAVLEVYRPVGAGVRAGIIVLTVVALVLALAYRRRAWLAVIMAGSYAAGAYGLVLFSTRYDQMGVAAVWENRYLSDIPPMLVLGLMFVVTPLRTATTDDSLIRPLPRGGRLAAKATLGAYLVLAGCLAVGVSVRNWQEIERTSPRPWVDGLVGDAKRVGAANLYDGVAPDYVINPIYMFGRANVSDLLSALELPVTYNEPAPAILLPNQDGRLVEGEVTAPAAASVEGPQPDCGYLVEAGKTTTVPLGAAVYDYEWAVQLDYFSATDLDLTVNAGETETVVPISATDPGTIGRRIWVLVGAFDHLELTSSSGQPFCVTTVAVGGLSPTDRRPAFRN